MHGMLPSEPWGFEAHQYVLVLVLIQMCQLNLAFPYVVVVPGVPGIKEFLMLALLIF